MLSSLAIEIEFSNDIIVCYIVNIYVSVSLVINLKPSHVLSQEKQKVISTRFMSPTFRFYFLVNALILFLWEMIHTVHNTISPSLPTLTRCTTIRHRKALQDFISGLIDISDDGNNY